MVNFGNTALSGGRISKNTFFFISLDRVLDFLFGIFFLGNDLMISPELRRPMRLDALPTIEKRHKTKLNTLDLIQHKLKILLTKYIFYSQKNKFKNI